MDERRHSDDSLLAMMMPRLVRIAMTYLIYGA